MNTVVDRILEVIKNKDISKRAFADEVGINPDSFYSAIRRNSDITSSMLGKIAAEHVHLNTRWLLTGEGEMWSNDIIKNLNYNELIMWEMQEKITHYKSLLVIQEKTQQSLEKSLESYQKMNMELKKLLNEVIEGQERSEKAKSRLKSINLDQEKKTG